MKFIFKCKKNIYKMNQNQVTSFGVGQHVVATGVSSAGANAVAPQVYRQQQQQTNIALSYKLSNSDYNDQLIDQISEMLKPLNPQHYNIYTDLNNITEISFNISQL